VRAFTILNFRIILEKVNFNADPCICVRMITMTIMPSRVLLMMVSTLVFLYALYDFFIAPDNAGYGYVYGQGFDQREHFDSNGIDSERQKDPSIHLVDVPLNFTVLGKDDDKNDNNNSNIINRFKSSNLPSDSSLVTNSTLQDEFTKGFCGTNSTITEYSDYVLEYELPQSCEMPLGIAVDSEDNQVWYVSTKKGILGMYDIAKNKFEQHTIPQWYVRENPKSFSQVWDVKIDDENNDESDEIWFTDAAQNAIWRFKKSTGQFELYRIPGQSESFGTTYPITINIVTNESANGDSNDEEDFIKDGFKSIYFIGTFAPSLWYAEIEDLQNGTTSGIHELKLPIEHGFRNIDPFYVTSGSFEFDEDRNSVWISMLSYSRKGQILEYDLDSKAFNIFGLPDDLSSPLGIVLGDSNPDKNSNRGDTSTELWITNPGTSIFHNYEVSEREKMKSEDENKQDSAREARIDHTSYDVDIERYTTSMASPRIFGIPFHNSSSNIDNSADGIQINDLRNKYYTLPSWIKKSSDGSIWFNQQQGNKISKFDPSEQELVEYWIPSQNSEWGNCKDVVRSNKQYHNVVKNCGIANVLNFALMENDDKGREEDWNNAVEEVWFTEWSTNKIGRIDASKNLPFEIKIPESDREVTVKRGESEKIELVIEKNLKKDYEDQNDDIDDSAGKDDNNDDADEETPIRGMSGYNDLIMMTAAGTFTSTGYLGNSTGYFDVPIISYEQNSDDNDNDDVIEQEVSFVFTPSENMIPGEYTLMLGAEDKSISILKAVQMHIL
jgi:virginiamycin B lyase